MKPLKKTIKKRTQRDYNLGFKLGVISQVEKGEMTYKQAQKACGIQGRSTVLVWLRKHGTLDWTKPIHHQMPKIKRDSCTEDQAFRTRTIGCEFLIYKCNNGKELKQLIDQSIDTYNNRRPHLSLNMKAPNFIHNKKPEKLASQV